METGAISITTHIAKRAITIVGSIIRIAKNATMTTNTCVTIATTMIMKMIVSWKKNKTNVRTDGRILLKNFVQIVKPMNATMKKTAKRSKCGKENANQEDHVRVTENVLGLMNVNVKKGGWEITVNLRTMVSHNLNVLISQDNQNVSVVVMDNVSNLILVYVTKIGLGKTVVTEMFTNAMVLILTVLTFAVDMGYVLRTVPVSATKVLFAMIVMFCSV